jgi:hypothetical protein
MNKYSPRTTQVFINVIESYTGRLIDSHDISSLQKVTDGYIRSLASRYQGHPHKVFFVRTIKSPSYTGPTHRYHIVHADGYKTFKTYMVKETISRRPKRSARP